MRHRPERLRAALVLTAAAAVVAALLPASASSGAASSGAAVATADPTSPGSRQAAAAVDRARSVAEGRAAGDLTAALRQVANTRGSLGGEDRAAAAALLARPTDDTGPFAYQTEDVARECNASVCVHYVTTTADAPATADATGNEVPDYIDIVLAVVGYFHDTYADAGYRSPRPDGLLGGDGRFDVYVGDIGGDGGNAGDGYCVADQPADETTGSSWAWCALDDDYARGQYPRNTPTENLAIAAAHHVFTATQYAYDRFEDQWLLDATATWVEDEIFDQVDDNVRFLATSQLRRPQVPLDTRTGGFGDGAWSFIRYLSERYPTKRGALPRIVLDIFQKADAAPGAPDMFSWQAVNAALRARGSTGKKAVAGYAVANRRPALSYDEGKANRYPAAPLAARDVVTPTAGSRRSFRLDHLTSATVRLTPRGLKDPQARLRISYDLPPLVRGSMVMLTKLLRTGELESRPVVLNAQGNATKVVPFDQRRVSWIEITLVNGSGRFRCPLDDSGPYSCQGTSLDDDQLMKLTATPLR